MLLENQNAVEVKEELIKLINGFLEKDVEEGINFLLMTRDGRKRKLKRHHCSPAFQYDALGVKDMAGRDSKKVFVILSSKVSNTFNTTVTKLVTPSREISDFSDDDITFLPLSPISRASSSTT